MLHLTWKGALAGAVCAWGAVMAGTLGLYAAAVLLHQLAPTMSGWLSTDHAIEAARSVVLDWPWAWILLVSALVGIGIAHLLRAIDEHSARRDEARVQRATICAECKGPKILHGNPAIWICADPTCIMREGSWWER